MVIFFFILSFLIAQTPLDQTTTVTLSGDYQPAEIAFAGSAGSRVDVTARSMAAEPIDVTLELLLNNQRLAFNDDHGLDRNDLAEHDARLEPLTLPADGDYTVRINSFSGAQTGDVLVTIQVNPPQPCPVAYFQWYVLPANERFECFLELEAGSVVTISARRVVEDNFDAVLEVRGEAGQLAFSDDSQDGASSDAWIENLEIPAAGRYHMLVSEFTGAGGTFGFEVTITP